jgi:uncharacterized membrane protein (DUF441 family)
MGDQAVSLIRTIVPVVVGSFITWLAGRGVDIDGAAVAPIVTTLVVAGYYAAVRAAEQRWPHAGWLLGVARPPSYPKPSDG